MKWLEIKKKLSFWSVIFSYSTQQMKHFSSDCDLQQKVDFTWQLVTTSSMAGWETLKHFPKPNLHQKRSWSLFGAASLLHYSFLSSVETITSEKHAQQINEVHWKLQCRQLARVNRKGPILLQTTPNYTSPTNVSKVAQTAPQSFASSSIFMTSCQPNTTSSSILTTFCRENASTTSRTMQKCFPRVHWLLKHRFFML